MNTKEDIINIPFWAKVLLDFIEALDVAIFPEEPYETIIVEALDVNEEEQKILDDLWEKRKSIICFIPSLKKYGLALRRFEERMSADFGNLRLPDSRKNFEGLPSLTMEELVLSTAAHEVRHRVQTELGIDILIPGDETKASNPNLQALLAQYSYIFKHSPTFKNLSLIEYDAEVIGIIIASWWHIGMRDFKSLGDIIKKNGKEILKKDNVLFFLFN